MNQQKRFIGWEGPVANEWVLISLEGEEAISEPFCWHACFTTPAGIDPAAWLGKTIACRIGEDDTQRFVHGVLMHLEQQHDRDGKHYFRATIEPQLVRTRHCQNMRVFQRTNVPDLVQTLLKEHEITDVSLSLSDSYPEQEYFIQYRESDFDFIHRLLESAGISYFFVHQKDKHQLVLADHEKAWPVSAVATLPFHPVAGVQEHAGVSGWTVQQSVTTPVTSPLSNAAQWPIAGFSHLDANGEQEEARQQQLGQLHQQRSELNQKTFKGEMNAFWLAAGEHFDLSAHPTASARYGIQRINLSASSNLTSTSEFTCSVVCWPLSQRLRPAKVTSVPSITGMLTATVVGPDSEEVHTDEQGRIKIQFPWDEENGRDDSSSCWIRIAQPWAGSKYGAMFLPRIGSEVLVSFLQGHPDYPIVIGSVYSDLNPLPFALPDEKLHSGFVSRSSPKGEITEGHRIVFDDKKDAEKLIVSSQKDWHLKVLNDSETEIGNDLTLTVAANRRSEITKGNDLLTLKEGNREELLEKGNYRLSLSDGDYACNVKGNQTITVKAGDQKTTITGGGSQFKADKACVIESGESITFKVGSNEIALTSSGITLKVGGTEMSLTASEVNLKAATLALQAQAEVKVAGAKVDVKGNAMVTIDGGLVKIGL
ncbi:type VI secretion system Vgr family protein [Pantoea sp. SO10]|uniref:type VI secretion system Vgr family protein n=1 Tax=Pantoea sp. SO10 TaxID=2575375 RepID=UPI0010CA0614|nr:type VI secretion system tip protein TssI/VgrG [Pantoea sp. SO10]QCP59329.1 type VI secretion system tip protein VgrG [Pantoea sp. SO10]